MKYLGSVISAAGLAYAILAVLSGCGGPALSPDELGASGQQNLVNSAEQFEHFTGRTSVDGSAPTAQRNRRQSWIRAGAKQTSLLYATDGATGEVDIYSNYESKNAALYGQITGFGFFDILYSPCSDTQGNVYITDSTTNAVYEYTYGSTTRVKTLNLGATYFGGSAIGCSVDPGTGNLAVAASAIWVFPNASGTPSTYRDPNVSIFWPPSYDSRGNLFVEGTKNFTTKYLDELPAGGSKLKELSLVGGSINDPGGVQWDGKYLAVSSGGATTNVYRVSVSGSNATVKQTILLTDDCYPSADKADVYQPLIDGSTIMGGNLFCSSRFDFWGYPRGGNPERVLNPSIAPIEGLGQTISIAPSSK